MEQDTKSERRVQAESCLQIEPLVVPDHIELAHNGVFAVPKHLPNFKCIVALGVDIRSEASEFSHVRHSDCTSGQDLQ